MDLVTLLHIPHLKHIRVSIRLKPGFGARALKKRAHVFNEPLVTAIRA